MQANRPEPYASHGTVKAQSHELGSDTASHCQVQPARPNQRALTVTWFEGRLWPTLFWARTWYVYVWPLTTDLSVYVVLVTPLATLWNVLALERCTTYVTPGVVLAVHVNETEPVLTLAVRLAGTDGNATGVLVCFGV